MEFFSMGMFCIDEIHLPDVSYVDVVGGAGTYALLGAAVLLPRSERKSIGFICDEGYDFSCSMLEEMELWGTGTIFRRDDGRETTKAWNKFTNNEERLFKYLSPKKQIFFNDMPDSTRNAKVVHLICSPARCDEFVRSLRDRGKEDQIYIWEPVPTEAKPERFGELRKVVETRGIHVLSPNALEAANFVGLSEPETKEEVEYMVEEYYGFAKTVLLRCGAMGSYLKTDGHGKWYPPYHGREDASRVVDPSGAGNGFMGGLGIALSRNADWDDAVASASIGASFMIEQVGPPRYDAGNDTWNGESGLARLMRYKEKIHNPN